MTADCPRTRSFKLAPTRPHAVPGQATLANTLLPTTSSTRLRTVGRKGGGRVSQRGRFVPLACLVIRRPACHSPKPSPRSRPESLSRVQENGGGSRKGD